MRRSGSSFAHPLLVLITAKNDLPHVRIAVTASRTLGGAVQRNRAKRRLRGAVTPSIPALEPGWDLVLIARKPVLNAPFPTLQDALQELLTRAKILEGGPG